MDIERLRRLAAIGDMDAAIEYMHSSRRRGVDVLLEDPGIVVMVASNIILSSTAPGVRIRDVRSDMARAIGDPDVRMHLIRAIVSAGIMPEPVVEPLPVLGVYIYEPPSDKIESDRLSYALSAMREVSDLVGIVREIETPWAFDFIDMVGAYWRGYDVFTEEGEIFHPYTSSILRNSLLRGNLVLEDTSSTSFIRLRGTRGSVVIQREDFFDFTDREFRNILSVVRD